MALLVSMAVAVPRMLSTSPIPGRAGASGRAGGAGVLLSTATGGSARTGLLASAEAGLAGAWASASITVSVTVAGSTAAIVRGAETGWLSIDSLKSSRERKAAAAMRTRIPTARPMNASLVFHSTLQFCGRDYQSRGALSRVCLRPWSATPRDRNPCCNSAGGQVFCAPFSGRRNMASQFGKLFGLTTFGESHGHALGAVVDGCPSRLQADRGRCAGPVGQAAARAAQGPEPRPIAPHQAR